MKTEQEILSQMKMVCDQLGHFPTQMELRKLNRSDIENSLKYLDYSYSELATKLGFVSNQYPRGFWQDWNNLEKELRKIITNDRFPTCAEIKNKISSGAISSIMYFGGIKTVADKMGYELKHFYEAADGHYLNSANELIFDEYLFANEIPHQVNGLIDNNFNFRYDFKVGDFYIEIWGFESNREDNIRCVRYKEKRTKKEKFYEDLGIKPISIEHGVFKKSFSEMKTEFDKIVEKYFPTKINHIDSIFAIHNTVKTAYYWNEEKIISELVV